MLGQFWKHNDYIFAMLRYFNVYLSASSVAIIIKFYSLPLCLQCSTIQLLHIRAAHN